ncbi:hypothetical protein IWZ03DRAFT_410557 [Phyllosticta citriasiana]|uniref:VWFA domain-containing protein n=1 Tax=Phyllosticta citriasiana TaxID=595635 RepID=A0ABR1KY36_9PEZI
MVPHAKSAMPLPANTRSTSEIKVRKRREDRSSASSYSANQALDEAEERSIKIPSSHSLRSDDAQEPLSAASSSLNSGPPSVPKRRSSKKVLAKVLGTIQNNKAPSLQTPVRNGQSDGSLFRKLSMKSKSTLQPRSRSSEVSLTVSPALNTTNSHSTPKARPSLNVFPDGAPQFSSPLTAGSRTPPRTNFTNKPPPILTVDLNVMSELETLSLYEERVMWVAVEASGAVRTRDEPNRAPEVGLDVVVVLDNSRFASPECLEIACDVALHIAESSTETDDRIAVFCTSCRHFPNVAKSSGCLLHPLGPANLASIRNEIASIKSLAEQPPPASSDLRETLLEAIKVLNEPSDRSVEPLRRERSHVFVLSPRMIGQNLANEGLDVLKLHCVCTAAIPYHQTTCPASNEWILPLALRLNFEQTGVAKTDCDHLSTQVADVLAYARMGNSPGHITDLQLHIRSSTGCAVESMLGTLSCEILNPGKTMSTLVRVKVPAIVPPSPKTPTSLVRNVDGALADLEMLLGETVTKLFTVKAYYRQSLFPENNFVTVESSCQIKRRNPLSPWSISLPTDMFRALRAEAELYKRFVFLVATQDPPVVALETLATFYENKRCSLPCSGYIERVRTELLHQLEAQTPVPSVMSRTGPSTPTQSQHSLTPDGLATPRHVDTHQPQHYPSHPHFSFSPHDSLRFTTRKPPPSPTAPQTVQRASSASPVLRSKFNQRAQLPFSPTITAFVDTPLPSSAVVRSGAFVASGSPGLKPNLNKPKNNNGGGGGGGIMMLDSPQSRSQQAAAAASVSSPNNTTSSSSPIDEARAIWRHMRRNVSTRGRSTAGAVPSWPAGYRRGTVVTGEAIGRGGGGSGGGDASAGIININLGTNTRSTTSLTSSSSPGVIAENISSSPLGGGGGGVSCHTNNTSPTTTVASSAVDVGRALVRERRERREHEWKRRALRNKRSLGADTLRSLALGPDGDGDWDVDGASFR